MNFYKRLKLAYRGNIPKMEDPDEKKIHTIGLVNLEMETGFN